MKKLFFLLLIPFVFACSSDDEDYQYIDNSLIEGKWYQTGKTDSILFIFENNKCVIETYNRNTLTLEDKVDFGNYKITKELLFLQNYHKESITYGFSKNMLLIFWDKKEYAQANYRVEE